MLMIEYVSPKTKTILVENQGFLENNLGPPIDATGADLHIDEK